MPTRPFFLCVLLCAFALALAIPAPPAAARPKLAAFKKDSVVVFQGDSITDGGRYSETDFNHTMGQDYAYIIAADIGARYPERNLTFLNRGVSGNTVVNLASRWQKDTLELKPDVLSIMVGINDTLFSGGETVETYEQVYDSLIRDTLARLPGVRIVLAEPFVMPVGDRKAGYPATLAEVRKRQAVVARLGETYHLPVIHYQAVFDAACARAPAEHWSWDGVHPTYAGHGLMAAEWLRVVDHAWRQ